MRKITLLAVLLVPLLVAGCADSEPAIVHEDSYEVPAGTGIEIDLDTQEGDQIVIDGEATGEMVWDFHKHDEQGTLVGLEDGEGASFTVDHEADSSTTHSLLVENPGDEEITVDVTIRGDVDVSNFQRV